MKEAEGVGFEPTVPYGTTVFKTAAIDHSATPPGPQIYEELQDETSFKAVIGMKPGKLTVDRP